MSWIGLRDATEAVLAPAGLGHPAGPAPDAEAVIPTGTLWIEFRQEAAGRPVNVLRYTRRDPVASVLTLRADPDGTLALMVRRGAQDALYTLHLPGLIPGDTVQVSYQWDSAAGRGVFAAQVPDRGLTRLVGFATVLAPTWRDATHLMADLGAGQACAGLTLAALATHLAPIGPLPVLDGAGLVETPRGSRAVEALRLGETVIAADGAPAQIRWIGSAVLPARGMSRPHLLRAPYMGLKQDLCLSGSANLRLSGIEVEYLFGDAEVAVPVQHLADRVAVLALGRGAQGTTPAPYVRRYHQVVLDRNVALRVSGVTIETLDAARILSDPALHRWSLLAGIPAELLPRAPASLCTRLRDYEAQTLRQMRAA